MIKWDQQLGESLGIRVRYPDLRLGIELEYERMLNEYPLLDYWLLERDPSLRNNGVEYISIPLAENNLEAALAEAQESITRNELEATWRCGGHTHVNVAYWTWKQLLSHAVLYTLTEPWLFAQFAPGRETNHFCVPMWANTRLIDAFANDAVALRAGMGQRRTLGILECSKYSALNYKPITIHGTIEFRHIPGTTDMDKVLEWCRFLTRMVEVAHEYDGPDAVIQEYEDLGIDEMLRRVGLHTCEVDAQDAEDAYIAASMMIGYDPQRWQDLNWDFPEDHQPDLQVVDEIGHVNREVWIENQEFLNLIMRQGVREEVLQRVNQILEGDE